MIDSRSTVALRVVTATLMVAAAAHAQSSIRTYGSGTPGTGGTAPAIWVTTTPHDGTPNFGVTVEDGPALAATTGFLSFAPFSASLFGLDILVDLGLAIDLGNIALSNSGDGTFPIQLPATPVLANVPLFAQAFVLDAGSTAQIPLTTTEGLEFSIRIGPATLLAAHGTPSSNDNQTAIDLQSGTRFDFGAANVDNARDTTFSTDGTIACLSTTAGDSIEVFDVLSLPPTHIQSLSAAGVPGTPNVIGTSPDGLLLYVGSGESGATGGDLLEVFFGLPFDPLFGQPFGTPPLPIGSSATELVFKPDGTRAYLAMFGILSPASVLEIDADTTSPTFHTVLDQSSFGSTVWSVAANDEFIYVASGPLLGPASIFVLETATFQQVDFDPIAPGTQPLGGEISIPSTDVDPQTNRIAIGPRGRFLYTANSDTVSRINVDADSPDFRDVLTVPTGTSLGGFELVVSDAGDLLYVSFSTSDDIVEYATSSMTPQRRWSVAPNPRDLSIR